MFRSISLSLASKPIYAQNTHVFEKFFSNVASFGQLSAVTVAFMQVKNEKCFRLLSISIIDLRFMYAASEVISQKFIMKIF